jgi:ornithine decarboxylase
MEFFRRFTFLVCAPAFDPEDLEGHRLGQITAAIEKLGFHGVPAPSIDIKTQSANHTFRATGITEHLWARRSRYNIHRLLRRA